MSMRREFSAEFKREAVQMSTMPGVTLREVAKDLGVGESVLGRWKRDLASHGKQARVVKMDTDRYGRIVGREYVGEIDVNRELVAQGFAWVYRKYSDDAELLRLETEAKDKGLGLWADPNPIPPWEWRRGRRE